MRMAAAWLVMVWTFQMAAWGSIAQTTDRCTLFRPEFERFEVDKM